LNSDKFKENILYNDNTSTLKTKMIRCTLLNVLYKIKINEVWGQFSLKKINMRRKEMGMNHVQSGNGLFLSIEENYFGLLAN
jgi:hypothetical protein